MRGEPLTQVRMKHEHPDYVWFGIGDVLKDDERGWTLVQWPTAAGVQWVETYRLVKVEQ